MRASLALFLGLALVLATASGAYAQGSEPSFEPAGAMDVAGRPSGYTGPGYYAIDPDELNFQYYDGQAWSGPVVGPQLVGLHIALRTMGHGDALDYLAAALGGDGDGYYLALIVLALLASRLPAVVTPTPPSPVATPVSSPSPEPPQVELAANLSPNYRFVWNWGSTIGGFDGTVGGDVGGWTYTGTSISSWPPDLHAWGGTASCTFEGDPDAPHPASGWPMDCDIYWAGDATWTGRISGRFYPAHDEAGTLTDFEFKGIGQGTNGGVWSPISILLKPCEPGAVC